MIMSFDGSKVVCVCVCCAASVSHFFLVAEGEEANVGI